MTTFDNFIYNDRPVRVRKCDCRGCMSSGEYRAPKNRELTDYYWFCLDHVRDYNRGWDYFAGMNGTQIESYTRSAGVWERPSWPMGEWHAREQSLRDQVMREFFTDVGGVEAPSGPPPLPKAERDALLVLELSPPVSFVAIKAQYRLLVKKHHPDANGGSREAEEKFKSINHAFAVLKDIYDTEEVKGVVSL